MKQAVIINNFNDVKQVVSCASLIPEDVDVEDSNGCIADAKSILGMMSLNYNSPVNIITKEPKHMDLVCKALEKSQKVIKD